jgi:AAA family ATP:ADP antiporter
MLRRHMHPPDNHPDGASNGPPPAWLRILRLAVDVDRTDVARLLAATIFGFCLLASYYILKPIRDEIGAQDRDNLQTLWTSVFFVMLAIAPIHALVAARFTRAKLVLVVYQFLAVNLLAFFLLFVMRPFPTMIGVERVFYVWTSVYVLYVVSLFWAHISEIFTTGQAKRLFGFIAVGCTIGAIAGSAITSSLTSIIGPAQLMLVALFLLEAASLCSMWLARTRPSNSPAGEGGKQSTAARGGRLDAPVRMPTLTALRRGVGTIATSPYLLGITGYIFLMTLASTFLYFQQSEILREAMDDRDQRRVLLANMELATNALVLLVQCFVTGRLMTRLGVGPVLTLLPLITIGVFAALGSSPTLAVLVTCKIIYSASRYALAKPSRETLFTLVTPEQRYQAKPLLDTAVYRGGDVVNGWYYHLLADTVGLSLRALGWAVIPAAIVWSVIAVFLGRAQRRREDLSTESAQ